MSYLRNPSLVKQALLPCYFQNCVGIIGLLFLPINLGRDSDVPNLSVVPDYN